MPKYPIRAVAYMTGLSIDTLRAWERRYSAVTPAKTGRGVRQYTDQDVLRLTLLRQTLQIGHSIGQVAALSNDELREIVERHRAAAAEARPAEAGSDPRIATLLDAIDQFDHRAMEVEFTRLATLLPAADLVYRVVIPLMQEVGARWQKGSFSVAQEHLASAGLRNVLGAMLRSQPLRVGAKTLIFATPAGEMHEFGVLAAAMLCVSHGLTPLYLGPNLPAREILYAAGKVSPRAVVLSVTYSGVAAQGAVEVEQLAERLAGDVEIWVGGRHGAAAIPESHRGRVVHIRDTDDVERSLRRLHDREAGVVRHARASL